MRQKEISNISNNKGIYYFYQMKQQVLTLFITFCLGYSLFSQELSQDTFLDLPEFEVKVAKLKLSSPPYSVSSINVVPLVNQGTSVNDYLYSLPGIFTLSANNFAQDTRLSSRGFGARSAFGVRGIKIITDDLPDSSPDGQAQLDNIDFGALSKIELLRGPHAGLYGNNSGGVLNIYTADLDQPSSTEVSYRLGSYGFQQWRAGANYKGNNFKSSFSFNNTRIDGYRSWSKFKNTIVNGILQYDIDTFHFLKIILNHVNSPVANDPGGVNLEELSNGRKLARDKNVQFEAGERVLQSKAGLIYSFTHNEGKNKLIVKSYFIKRKFENKLPFENNGAVSIDRQLYGFSLDYLFNFKLLKRKFVNQIGFEYDDQNDWRRQFTNTNGNIGTKGFDQNEYFKSKATYLLTNVKLTDKWSANLNLRNDGIESKAIDNFIANGDQSGEKNIKNFNYSISIERVINKSLTLVGIKSTGFESPTLNELSNNPGNIGGFNTGLQAMNSNNSEINGKIKISNKFVGQVSLFNITSKNEITAYELPGQNGRSYYRNAGATNRKGLEVEGQYQLTKYLISTFNYTWSNFKYGNYLTFNNKFLPGLSRHMAYFNLTVKPLKNTLLIFENRFVSKMYLNDANTDITKAFVESNVKLKYSYTTNKTSIHFYTGLNNFFNQNYFSNLRINAAGSRYFETAQPFNIYFGCAVQNIWQTIGKQDLTIK